MRDLKDLPNLTAKGVAAPGYEYLVARGLLPERLDVLIPEFDLRYEDESRRVVFPVREGGQYLGYTARAIDPWVRKRWLDWPLEGGHKNSIYEADRVLMGGDTLFVVEGPFDALCVTAALGSYSRSVATAFFGPGAMPAQIDYIVRAKPLYRMVYFMLDANVFSRCRALAQQLDVGAIHIGVEYRDPGATPIAELERLVAYAETSSQPLIRWMWERHLVAGWKGV